MINVLLKADQVINVLLNDLLDQWYGGDMGTNLSFESVQMKWSS